MTNQIVIELVEEVNCKEAESYQEGKMAKMEQEIDDIKETIGDVKNSSYQNSLDYNLRDSSDEDLEGYSHIHAT